MQCKFPKGTKVLRQCRMSSRACPLRCSLVPQVRGYETFCLVLYKELTSVTETGQSTETQ
jgi:hypothetical protein